MLDISHKICYNVCTELGKEFFIIFSLWTMKKGEKTMRSIGFLSHFHFLVSYYDTL